MPRRRTARSKTETTQRTPRRSRGVRIPFKLAIAATPLVLAIGGLLAATVRGTTDEADHQHRSAQIVAAWAPLNVAIDAVELERAMTIVDGSDTRDTDAAFWGLRQAVAGLDAPQVEAELTDAVQDVRSARASRRAGAAAATLLYRQAIDDLGQLGDLLAGAAADVELGRDLQALAALQHVRQTVGEISDTVVSGTAGAPIEPLALSLLVEASRDSVSSFTAAAPSAWTSKWTASGVPEVLGASEDEYLALVVAQPADMAQQLAATDVAEYRATDGRIRAMFDGFTDALIAAAERAETDARTTSRTTLVGASLAVLVALLVTWRVTRSVTRRIRAVSAHAHDVATTQLPTLVQALRDPRGRSALPQSRLIESVGTDEVGDLAESFNAMQTTLVGVAEEQMAVLRRGVSDIFVTLARRNRSLVDRQLSLLDALESDVDDPKVLGDYFKLDHLATRMRRNAESLLVLAHAETRHRRSDPYAVDDVVRAAISEVEDYQRIDVLSVEPMVLKASAVADMSHLLAELIDNAAVFSPPTSHVHVSGALAGSDGYDITIRDLGMGIATERLAELNDLLTTPPVIGLSVEPTLGLSVVSLLAHKHGVRVVLTSASPGIEASVRLPAALFEGAPDAQPDRSYIDVPTHAPASVTAARLTISDEQLLAVDLAASAPTPEPRLRRLDAELVEGAALAPVPPADHAATPPATQGCVDPDATGGRLSTPPAAAPAAGAARVDLDATVAASSTQPGDESAAAGALPVRRPAASVGAAMAAEHDDAPRTTGPLPGRPATAPLTLVHDAGAAGEHRPPVDAAAQDAPVARLAVVPPFVALPEAPTSAAPSHQRPPDERAAGAARPVPQPPSSTAGSSPNDVRDPAAMLSIGRPLFEGSATAAGLPLRTPGRAQPNVGGDERSVGVSQPDQMRANLAAFARGMTSAAAGSTLDARVAAERAALAARPLLPKVPAGFAPRLAAATDPAADVIAPPSPSGDVTSERTPR